MDQQAGPFYVDNNHADNATILKCLSGSLGDPRADLVAYFEQCISPFVPNRPNSRGEINGYPVFVYLDSGVIMAAVCGKYAVALRYTNSRFRRAALQVGATPTIRTGVFSTLDLGEDWIFTEGTLELRSVYHDLGVSFNHFSRPFRAEPVSTPTSGSQNYASQITLRADHPSNVAALAYFQTAHTGSVHPDIPEFLWHELPRQANLPENMGQIVQGTIVLVHPTSGLIFAYITGTPWLGLRLPESMRSPIFRNPKSGVQPVPELGEDWVAFNPFAQIDVSASRLTSAFTYAGRS